MKKLIVAMTLLAMSQFSWAERRDCDNNPPGRRGGQGTNWENPRGPAGGPGFGRRWGDNDNNPPGRVGGRGTNWENPRGPVGGPGFGSRWGDNDNNPPGRIGGRGTNWENRPGRRGGRGASPNRRCR
jgi:hypothetical protein